MPFSYARQQNENETSCSSSHPHFPRTRLHHPSGHQSGTPGHHDRASKHLRIEIPALALLDERARQRRPRERRKAHNTKHHAHADARLLEIGGETAQRGGEEALDARGEKAVHDGEGDEAALGGHGGPGVEQHGGDEGEGDEGVEGPEVAVGEEGGDEAADEADAVEDEQVGDAVRVGYMQDRAAEGGEVVEGEVEAPEAEEHAEGEEQIGGLGEGGPFDQRAGFARGQARAGEGEGDGLDGEHDEAQDADGPREADPGQQLLDDGGEDDAAGRCARGGDADGHGAFGGEVGGEQSEAGAEEEAVADAGADSLGEEELPVFCAQGGHEDAQQEED